MYIMHKLSAMKELIKISFVYIISILWGKEKPFCEGRRNNINSNGQWTNVSPPSFLKSMDNRRI